ncbi:MAG: phage tail tape measure protein [Ramlibacter sp.]
MDLALVLRLQDRLIGPLRQSVDACERELKELQDQLKATERASAGAGDGLEKLGDKASRGGKRARDELRGLGEEADRAGKKTRDLGSTLEASLAKMRRIGQGAMGAFAGYQAGKMVLAQPLQRAEDYELELARLSNTAYADRKTVAGRQAGQRELDQTIRNATLQGVTREDAMAGLKTMIAGGVSRDAAKTMLPMISKYAMAGVVGAEDIANIAIKSAKSSEIDPSEIGDILEQGLTAGKLGNFEFKDMARWLPQQIAMAKGMLGMSGKKDFATLLAANQMAATTAGSSAEAGNNLVNFLGKINSFDTANDAKKLGIDLPGSLAAAREKGVDPINAFMNLLEQTAAGDKQYVALQERLKGAKGEKEKEATLRAMTDLMMGKSIGKLVQDRQALMGLLGILQDRKGFEELIARIQSSKGEGDLDQAVLRETTAIKNQQANNALYNAQYDALKGVNQGLADTKAWLGQLAGDYPNLAKAVVGLTLAAGAAAAALSALSIVALLQRGGAGGIASGALGAGAGALAGAARFAGGIGLAGGLGYGVGTLIHKGIEGTGFSNVIGRGVASVGSFFGSEEAARALQAEDAMERQVGSRARAALGQPAGSTVDWQAVMTEAKKPQEVVLKIDAPEFMTVQQISTQAARDARRQ